MGPPFKIGDASSFHCIEHHLFAITGVSVCIYKLSGRELTGVNAILSRLGLLRVDDAIRKNLLEGAMQGRGTVIPSLEFFLSLKQCLDSVSGNFNDGGKILLDISPGAEPLSSLDLRRLSPVCLAIGSERGWTEEERGLFREKGFISCSLGKRILRTETAVTASLALALGRMGLI